MWGSGKVARTTASQVKDVLRPGSQGGDYDDVNLPSLTPYIDAASTIVDRVKTCAAARDRTLSDAELEIIERWLSAHTYCLSDQVYTNKSTGGASAGFQGSTSLPSIEGTKYGQMALNLDWSGCLTAIAKRQFARASWLGRKPPEKAGYDWNEGI